MLALLWGYGDPVATASIASLTDKERALIAETQRAALQSLDEDQLLELLSRIRRARDKFVQLHRRAVGAQVGEKGARGSASIAPRRSASKAELFEDALARVSAALARAARTSAAELRAERIAAAQGAPSTPAATPRGTRTGSGGPASTPATKGRARQPIERKAAASTKATGARRQAARDAR